ncbi:hypothetical protein PanWU01x14_080730 [Parasponia andersonii]|uniref:Uncharacterized protein n=1 Tax=Parasponia andersonii TaxID=3476 RepID=A0A2P5DAU8_PARAD|nr:hypothetical protein PanWU01x14_080730 [Parasponia andersonii]
MIALTLALRLSPLLVMIPLLLVSNLSPWLDMLPAVSILMSSPPIPYQTSLIKIMLALFLNWHPYQSALLT